jgi:FixJ family two-component response regulator
MLNLAVIDDDSGVRIALRRLLAASGHDVQVFSSAEDFLARGTNPDCVILDVQLPGLSGFELEEQMRVSGSATPVVFITAHDSFAAREAFRRTRRPWVRKPFDHDRLLDAIAEATGEQDLTRSSRVQTTTRSF